MRHNHLPTLPDGYLEVLLERIDEYSQVQANGCIIWTGAQSGHDYGVIGVGAKLFHAHALVYELEHGPVPNDYELHHTCDTRLCINVQHLMLVTHAEHMRIHAKKPRRPTKRRS